MTQIAVASAMRLATVLRLMTVNPSVYAETRSAHPTRTGTNQIAIFAIRFDLQIFHAAVQRI
jgi:hypothetical protein